MLAAPGVRPNELATLERQGERELQTPIPELECPIANLDRRRQFEVLTHDMALRRLSSRGS